ncbi:hypothetical protein Ancab_039986 [Ancistrocladus abbreviatus]
MCGQNSKKTTICRKKKRQGDPKIKQTQQTGTPHMKPPAPKDKKPSQATPRSRHMHQQKPPTQQTREKTAAKQIEKNKKRSPNVCPKERIAAKTQTLNSPRDSQQSFAEKSTDFRIVKKHGQ